MLGCAVLNSNTISIKILEAILELSKIQIGENTAKQAQESDAQVEDQFESDVRKYAAETGVSLDSINTWLKTHCEGFDNLKSPLTVVLKREIDAGRVKRLTSCNYVITVAQLDEIGDSNTITPLKANKKAENKPGSSPKDGQNGSAGVSASEDSKSSGGDQSLSSNPEHRATQSAAAAAAAAAGSSAAGGSSTQQPARRGRPPKHRSQVSPSQGTSSTSVITAGPGATQSKVGLTFQILIFKPFIFNFSLH